MRGDHDRIIASASQFGDDVAFCQAGHKAPAHSHPGAYAFQVAQPDRVGAGDEDGRSDRDLTGAGQERNRRAAERTHQ